MSYKLTQQKQVSRIVDGAVLPCFYNAGAVIELDPYSPGVREFKAWLAAGNTPLPADPSPAPIDLSDINNLDKVLKALALLVRDYCNALQAGTYTQKTVAQLRTDFAAKYATLP